MEKYERIAALFLTLVGITTGAHSWLNLKLGTMNMPDSGFMPFLASLVLVIASGLWFMSALGQAGRSQPFWEGRGWVKPLLAILFMLVYAWSMDLIGYLLATLVFMLVWQFFVEREKWLKATVISLISTAVMWLLFSQLLGVPLPTGILTV